MNDIRCDTFSTWNAFSHWKRYKPAPKTASLPLSIFPYLRLSINWFTKSDTYFNERTIRSPRQRHSERAQTHTKTKIATTTKTLLSVFSTYARYYKANGSKRIAAMRLLLRQVRKRVNSLGTHTHIQTHVHICVHVICICIVNRLKARTNSMLDNKPLAKLHANCKMRRTAASTAVHS